MLHEILLSLYGHPSPGLLEASNIKATSADNPYILQLAPPERALLATLTNLSELHIELKKRTNRISSSHSSTICRAVSSAIVCTHLKKFRQKVLEVESLVLAKDAGYVGGYGIIPLSTIVGEFAPWTRRLEWLWQTARFMLPTPLQKEPSRPAGCSGAALINFLRQEANTGYVDIEEMATNLVAVAEMAWLRQLSSWVLYGKRPAVGAGDFFIQDRLSLGTNAPLPLEFKLDMNLAPDFVNLATADSLLFIGVSLNQIRSWYNKLPGSSPALTSDPVLAFLPAHLSYLKSLMSPVSPFVFSSTVSSIRSSLSQHALSQLLPVPKVLEILDVLHSFLLLGRGEFAVSLIANADERLRSRHRGQDPAKPVRKAGRLDDIEIKEGEIEAVLRQTWIDLFSLQNDEGPSDDTMETARERVRLVVEPAEERSQEIDSSLVNFRSLLFPASTSLTLSIPSDSPLSLFLSSADLGMYSAINAYLLSIRRADLHLGSLWKLTSLRRVFPCPHGPPTSCTPAGGRKLAAQRRRESERTRNMRPYWACTSKALFVMSELGVYFQGEVVRNHWEHFKNWLRSLGAERPLSSSGKGSRPGTASSSDAKGLFAASHSSTASRAAPSEMATRHIDPAMLAWAHQLFIRSLSAALLLADADFVNALRTLLTLVDHFTALFGRLQTVQQGLDLQEDEGVMDALANYDADEREILAELKRSRSALEQGLTDLVQAVRQVHLQQESGTTDRNYLENEFGDLTLREQAYTPWSARSIDRLIMKLDCLAGDATVGGKAMDEDDDDL